MNRIICKKLHSLRALWARLSGVPEAIASLEEVCVRRDYPSVGEMKMSVAENREGSPQSRWDGANDRRLMCDSFSRRRPFPAGAFDFGSLLVVSG